ncbi:hypothetical protein ACP70R_047860 [Stipagrostis hirtigluma subsp. patula]
MAVMVRKRARGDYAIDVSDNYESEDDGSSFADPVVDLVSESDSDKECDSDDDDSSDSEQMNGALYQQCLKELMGLEKLKEKLSKSIRHKAKKTKSTKKPKDAFTRFSVSYFASVIEALSPERKEMIESYGFGSLLKFQKCFVPNKFVQWVARQVDYKSGDIVVKSRIISLTSESVNLVLDTPIGGRPFPKDSNAGKSYLLSRFGLQSIPSVKFFGDKILNNEDMTKEDVFACFMLVALNCFLCPNSSLFPSSKYLGIFQDIENVKELDCSQFILDWLLDSVRTFNKQKTSSGKGKQTLGGCLYLLAVIYLDFDDFGHRQVQHGIPRILYWKDMMIKTYSQLDQIAPGIYGFRPVMDISTTCYSKQSVFLYKNPPSLTQNPQFLEQLESHFGCALPLDMKNGICKLIEDHCLNCALTMNMDITSLASLSDDLKKSFSTLLQHAYSIDTRTQSLVLKIFKLLSDSLNNDNEGQENAALSDQIPENVANETEVADDCHNCPDPPGSHHLPQNFEVQVCNNDGTSGVFSKSKMEQSHDESVLKEITNKNSSTPCQSSDKVSNVHVDKVMSKLQKKGFDGKENNTFSKPVPITPKSPCNQSIQNRKCKSRMQLVGNFETESEIAKLREDTSVFDVEDDSFKYEKKAVKFVRDNGERDVIYLDTVQEFRSEFVTPSPTGPISKLKFKKRSPVDEEEVNCSSKETPMFMQTLEESQHTPVRVTPNLSQHRALSALKTLSVRKNPSASLHKVSPEVQITGERTIFDKSTELSRKSEAKYNNELNMSKATCLNSASLSHTPMMHAAGSTKMPDNSNSSFPLKNKDSTTGGKLPHYGPRRVVQPIYPGPVNNFSAKNKFAVTRSEMKYYNAICKLAYSKFQDHPAVEIGGVKCTFKSLGDSMKPGGVVINFVVSVFCRHLFMKPQGHPDISKKHFFFSNIGDNFLKHPSDANYELLERAFHRSQKARKFVDSNLLFFPILFEGHWFVFIVDIKDHYFVFLDSFYGKDSPYQQHCRDRLIPSFMFHWDQFVDDEKDMKFDDYKVVYPPVPPQGPDNLNDGGVFVLMFLKSWESPRTVLSSIFNVNDIPNIRVKITNELMFLPQNTGLKRLVLQYDDKDFED